MKALFFFITFLFALSSCNMVANKVSKESIPLDSAIAKADRLNDSGKKLQAVTYMAGARPALGDLSIADEMRYTAYCNIIYMGLSDYDKSIDMADSMLVRLEKDGQEQNHNLYMEVYNMKADALMAKGMYNEAYDYYYKAKSLAVGNADSCSFSVYNHSLGIVLYRQQKYVEAAQYFKQSYAEALYCADNFTYFYLRQELLDNIGLSYSKVGMYDSAELYYMKTLSYIKEKFDKYPGKPLRSYESAEAVVWGNLADVYVSTGNYDSAKALLQHSIRINLQKDYTNSDAELSQIKLANIYLATRQLPELKDLLQDVKAELDTIPSAYVSVQWNKLTSKYYEQTGDSVSAYRYLLVYLSMNEAYTLQNKSLVSSDIDGRLKNQERQYQMALLQKNKKQGDTWLIIAIVIIAMSMAIIYLVLRYSSRVKGDMSALTELNKKVNENKAKLEQALREVELRDKDKSRILRSVAHDVMSPISAISALTDILLTDSVDRPEDEQEILKLIYEACTNSLNLSKDILDAASAIAPGDLIKEWVDVNKLVAGCVELLNARAHVKHQNIVIKTFETDIKAYIHKEKIWRVINNLLVNAIKFSYENSVITVSTSKVGENVVISVADTGMGITEKNKRNIFDMFTESKTYGTSGEKPHGIGLSISQQVVRAHDGEIWFESQEGRGTTFYVSLPQNLTKE